MVTSGELVGTFADPPADKYLGFDYRSTATITFAWPGRPLGKPHADRVMVVVAMGHGGGHQEVRLDTNAFTLVQQDDGGNRLKIWQLALASGDYGDLTISASGAVAINGMAYALYAIYPASATKVDSAGEELTNTVVTAAAVAVETGGRLIWGSKSDGNPTRTVEWTGGDGVTVLYNGEGGNGGSVGFGHIFGLTETDTTFDLAITHSLNVVNRVVAASWGPS